MAEGTFRSSFPLAYTVNSIEDLNEDVIKAFRSSDQAAIANLVAKDTTHFNIFICVNSSWHAFILCVPVGNPQVNSPFDPDIDFNASPYEVPDGLLCPHFELCFAIETERMYKMSYGVGYFKEIKARIKKSYFIARYAGVNIKGLQFAALRAAPKRYSVLLDDCVEFCKTFCQELLAYCSNYRVIEKQVFDNIKKASGSGFTAEVLSRRVRSSGWLGNSLLGGLDGSQFMSTSRYRVPILIALVTLLLIYPIVVAIFVVNRWGCGAN